MILSFIVAGIALFALVTFALSLTPRPPRPSLDYYAASDTEIKRLPQAQRGIGLVEHDSQTTGHDGDSG